MSEQWRPGEIVVEIGGQVNNYYLFKPLDAKLRGKWCARNHPNPVSSIGFTAIPDLPGIMVALDARRRTLRTVDPLSFPEHKKALDEANKIRANYLGEGEPCAPTLKKNLSDGDIKSTLWEMSEMVRAETATLVYGTLPAPEKIMAMDGRVRVRNTFILQDKEGQTNEATEEEEAQVLANAAPD